MASFWAYPLVFGRMKGRFHATKETFILPGPHWPASLDAEQEIPPMLTSLEAVSNLWIEASLQEQRQNTSLSMPFE